MKSRENQCNEQIKVKIEQYHQVFDGNPIPFMLYHLLSDSNGNYNACEIAFANGAAKAILEVNKVDLLEKTISELSEEKLAILVRANNSEEKVHDVCYDENSKKYLDIIAYREAEGYVAFVMIDVTQQKKAQLVLEESNAMYHLITEYTEVNIWKYDISSRTLYNSENSIRLHPGGMVIHDFPESAISAGMIREDSIKPLFDLYERLRNGEKVTSADIWFRSKNTDQWWCERIIYVTAFDAEGRPDHAVGIGENITAEINARMEQQKTQILLENTDISIWEYNEGKPDVLPQALQKKGVIHPESKTAYYELYKRIDQGENYVTGEICILTPKNKTMWYRMHLKRITSDRLNLSRSAIGWCTEITEYKEAECNFAAEAAYLEGAPNNNLLGKCRVNVTRNWVDDYIGAAELLITNENRKYTDSVDYVASLCVTNSSAEEFRRKLAPEQLQKIFAEGTREFHVDYMRQMYGKSILWVRTVVKLSGNPDTGDLMCFMYTYDIDQEKIMKMIVDHVADTEFDMMGLLYLDENLLHCIRASEMEAQMDAGVDVEYDMGMREYVARYMDQKSYEKIVEQLSIPTVQAMLEEHEIYTLVHPVIFQGKKCQKKWEFSFLDNSHKIVIFTRADITQLFEEQERQRETMRNALQQAEQASKAKTDFLSHMSHEIRTPMNAIIGMSTLAAQCINDPIQVSECISKVGISARYLLSLINDILDMSRIESGRVTLKNERFPFEELIGNINTIIYNQAKAKNVDYDCILGSFTDSYYIGDALKLQQVLLNLLGNAVKFTPPGGRTQLIVRQTKVERGRAYMTFTVNDTGIGISEDFKEKIFDPFEQAGAVSGAAYQGTGLGLAISKNLVTMMGGTITINSIEDVGTEFTVALTLGVCEDRKPRNLIPSLPLEKLRTLIVDDDVIICEHTQTILREMGVRAEWVSSGHQAIQLVEQKKQQHNYFDVVFLDWKMPDMDGIETARRLRTIVGPEVTIIVMTAYDWALLEQDAKAAGVNLLITKPLFKSTLTSAFQRIYNEKAQKEECSREVNYDFTGSHILLVEDHILNVEVAKRLLENKNATVDVVENGLRAIELFATAAEDYYDAILMDIRMPVMDGLTAAKSIRQLHKENSASVPIIAMSANAFEEDAEKSRIAGMNAHLSKPIEPMLLYATLDRFVHHRNEGQE